MLPSAKEAPGRAEVTPEPVAGREGAAGAHKQRSVVKQSGALALPVLPKKPEARSNAGLAV